MTIKSYPIKLPDISASVIADANIEQQVEHAYNNWYPQAEHILKEYNESDQEHVASIIKEQLQFMISYVQTHKDFMKVELESIVKMAFICSN